MLQPLNGRSSYFASIFTHVRMTISLLLAVDVWLTELHIDACLVGSVTQWYMSNYRRIPNRKGFNFLTRIRSCSFIIPSKLSGKRLITIGVLYYV